MGWFSRFVNALARRTSPAPPPVVVSPPAPTVVLPPSIGPVAIPERQLLFVGLTRHWSMLPAHEQATLVWRYGADGRSYELTELEERGIGQARTFQYMLNQVDRILPQITADRLLGMVSKIYLWQSNVDAGQQLSLTQLNAVTDKFARVVGWQGILVMPCNEDDDRAKATRDKMTSYTLRSMEGQLGSDQARRQLIDYQRDSSGGYIEYHPQNWGSYPGASHYRTIIAPDNGRILDALHSGDHHAPDAVPLLPQWRDLASKTWGQGKSFDAYNFMGHLDEAWVAAVCEACGRTRRGQASSSTAVPDAIDISRFKIIGLHRARDPRRARIAATITRGWTAGSEACIALVKPTGWNPRNSGISGWTDIDGNWYAFWQPESGELVGGIFDWHRVNDEAHDVKHITDGSFVDGQKPRRGQPWWLMLANNDCNERSNVVYMGLWPW